MIDHPWTGFGAATNTIVPLSDHFSSEYIKDQEVNTVGKSYKSYVFNNKLWALPIDAATPVAAARLDILESKGLKVPEVLLSGNFGKIEKWREEMAYEHTKNRRPDLLED